jgi:hypothetical protein
LSASLTDPNGGTGTATVTFQTGRLLGITEAVIKVTGDTTAEGTTVPVTINGTTVGNITIDSSGTGTLILPASGLGTTVAASSTIGIGTLAGSFNASATSPSTTTPLMSFSSLVRHRRH